MSGYIQVLTTVDSRGKAEEMATKLLEDRLAACVQIVGPVKSLYWWKGRIESSEEWLCMIKTTADLYAEVERRIKELHTYEVPEIVALPITAGYHGYLEWLASEVRKAR